jgi:hypothetical protein
MSHNNIPNPEEQNREALARLWDGVRKRGDGKCYCPCCQCKGFNRRRILITTTKRHCLQHGHVEGGHEYHPLVGCSLYMSLYCSFCKCMYDFYICYIYTNIY